MPRFFLRQVIELGGETEEVAAGPNQFPATTTVNRVVLTVGKFGVPDIFDTNRYAHDPRSDFMNWALADTGSFDYAADAWGYTYGAAAEWYQGQWTLRGGGFDLSTVPNSTALDPSFGQFQLVGEIERRFELWREPGKVAVTPWLSRGRMGTYTAAVRLAEMTGQPADITAVRRYRSRWGLAANLEQQLTPDWGLFLRTGFASPNVEPYEFTDIDRTVALGAQLTGRQWRRPDDTIGFAGILNGISGRHEAFLNAGGLGILIGDGRCRTPVWSRSSRPTTRSPSGPGGSPSTISSSTIRPTTVTGGRCRCWASGCTASSESRRGYTMLVTIMPTAASVTTPAPLATRPS